MKRNSFSKKRIIHIGIIIFILVMAIALSVLLMFKYNVEGEKNLPFNIKNIKIISSAETTIMENNEDKWRAEMLQKNNIFFTIEKNNNYKKQDAIKRISFENFEVIKNNEKMVVEKYRPAKSVNDYIYTEEYKLENSIEYLGGQLTNAEAMQINNQGGLIGFSIVSKNLGEFIFNENEKIPSDGRLLSKAGINKEDIKFKISFDLIVETESGNRFKSNVILDLPTGDILNEGVGTLEKTDLNDIIFKRF